METVRSADGTTIAFEQSGHGPALVMVVGAFCDHRSFGSLATVLDGDFTVYRYDRRGRGASGDTAPYAVQREIEDLAAVIGRTGETPLVFGHSSGAVLALEAAAAGIPLSRLAVYEPPYSAGGGRPGTADLVERTRRLLDEGRRGDAAELFLVEATRLPAPVVAMIRSQPGWADMEAIAHTLPYDLTICGDTAIPADRLARITVPTLVLGGAASGEGTRDAMLAVAAAIPGARHGSLEGQTHNPADEALAPVLDQFLRA